MPRHVHVQQDYTLPPERIFAHLAEHEHLAKVFGARAERVRDGETERNGVGSVRRLFVAPLLPPLEETVTTFEPAQRIVYRITKGGRPLNDDEGTMTFTAREDGGTRLDYRIRLGSAVPGVSLVVARGLERIMRRALPAVEGRA